MFLTRLLAIFILLSTFSGCSSAKRWLSGKTNGSNPDLVSRVQQIDDRDLLVRKDDIEQLEDDEQFKSQNLDAVDTKKDEISVRNSSLAKKSATTFLTENHKNNNFRSWIKYFTGRGKERFQRHLDNSEKYKEIVYSVLSQYNLPFDLFYIGLIESGYNTHIRSRANAVGPWQFVKGTAKGYGLIVSSHIDERVNIYKATEAAAKYFLDLYNIFGSWDLALCAYNSGEYRVMGAIRKGNTRNLSQLIKLRLLPRETRNYVPKLLAAKQIALNRGKYGFKRFKGKTQRELDEFVVRYSTTLEKLSKVSGLSKKTIKRYNPDIKSRWIKIPRRKSFTVYLPERNVAKLARVSSKTLRVRGLASARSKNKKRKSRKVASNRYHRVRKGETLIGISNRNSIGLSALLKLNRMRLRDKIYVGQKLKIAYKQPKYSYRTYRVRRGDNLSTLARKFKVPVRTLKRVNNLHSSKIFINKRLKIPVISI